MADRNRARYAIEINGYKGIRRRGKGSRTVYAIHCRATGIKLATVEWHSGWREYIVGSEHNLVFTARDLRNCAAFLERRNRLWQQRNKARDAAASAKVKTP